MHKLSFATIQDIKNGLAKKEYSHQEVLQYFLRQFAAHDESIKSALEVFDEQSILEKFHPGGILSGVPGIIKDNICQKDRIASCASKMLEHYQAPYDATAIARLKEQGALLVGRANLDEFAMGSSTETSAFFKTANPWNTKCVPGGSSGGSIAAVAAGMVPWSLGSETGGSVRHPAAFCGIVGLKPTYGSVSRYGLIAYASSLDQIGVATRTVYDSALVYSAIAGHDPKDASSLPQLSKKDYTQKLDGSLPQGLRIGIVRNAFDNTALDLEVRALSLDAVEQLKKSGATVHDVVLSTMDYGAATYFIISRAEAASNLSRYDGVRYGYRASDVDNLSELYTKTRSQGFGKEVKVRMMIGNYVLSAGYAAKYYHNAQKVQSLIRNEYLQAFKEYDILVMPSQASAAFEFGKFDNNKLQMDLQDYFLCTANLAGIPAMSIPCGFTKSGMPVGFQIIGPHLSEQLLFQVGHAYQQMTDWHMKYPKLG
ncbi:Asp-tRNA(Asn)/Glu-tRNA(Gln) amidotransferase subunit GatA [Candidatus Babeliales bacterium]|nr:Asp-tRNA(Asn)/Glu-tRNA(Gln) amidotransferase subunit GatA [Candidatus Babeliales bacterium]